MAKITKTPKMSKVAPTVDFKYYKNIFKLGLKTGPNMSKAASGFTLKNYAVNRI